MKKSEEKKSKKKVKSFEERFEGKKNAVGKAGLYELLDLHQPFSLENSSNHKGSISPQSPSKQSPLIKKKRLAKTHSKSKNVEHENLRSNRTQIPKRSSSTPKLPNISQNKPQRNSIKSSLDKLAQLDEDDRGYWRNSEQNTAGLKSKLKDMNYRNLMHADFHAVQHFEVLEKFEKKLRIAHRFGNKKA